MALKELPALRNWNSSSFLRDDGKIDTEFHVKWQNFMDENGEWKPIDCELKEIDGRFCTVDAPFSFKAPKYADEEAEFESNCKFDIFRKEKIKDAPFSQFIRAEDAAHVTGELYDLNGNGRMDSVIFPNAFPSLGADLIYFVHHGRAPRLQKLVRFSSEPSGSDDVRIRFKMRYSGDLTVRQTPAELTNKEKLAVQTEIVKAKNLFKKKMKHDTALAWDHVLKASMLCKREWDGEQKIITKKAIAHRPDGAESSMRGVGLKDFYVWDSGLRDAKKKQKIDVEYEWLTDTEFRLTKIVPRSFFGSVTFPVFTDTTSTFYPDPHTESTSVDGRAFRASGGTTFADLHDGAGNGGGDTDTETNIIQLEDSGTSNYKTIGRSFFLFDTSSLPDGDVVQAAVFSLKGSGSKADGLSVTPVVNVYSSNPASNTAIVPSTDFQTAGSTAYATGISYASWNTANYNDFTFNSTGRAAVSVNGITKLSIRDQNYDAANSAFPIGTAGDQDTYIRAYMADESGTTSDPKFVVTHAPPPTAPSGLTAVSQDGSQDIELNWTDNSSDESTFRIERSNDGVSGWAEIGNVAAGVTTYTDTTVGAWSTTRYYRVRVLRDSDGVYSSYTSSANAKTAPAAPTIGTVTATSDSNDLTLTWTDNSSDEDTFSIERSNNGTTGWSEIATDTSSPYVDTTVGARDTTRYYRVRAKRNAEPRYSAYSSTANGTTAPANPTGFAGSANGDDVSLAWGDASTTNTSYEIHKKKNAGAYAVAYTPTANAVSQADNNLVINSTYTYKIRAYRSTDDIYSGFSSEVAVGIPPEAPTNLQAFPKSDVTGNIAVQLMWDKNSRYETGIKVERSTDNMAWSTIATTAKGATVYEDTGLTVNTLYYYRVSAVGSAATSTTTSTTVTTKMNTAAGLLFQFLHKVRNFPRE